MEMASSMLSGRRGRWFIAKDGKVEKDG